MGKWHGKTPNVIAGIIDRNKQPGEKSKRSFRPPGWAPGPRAYNRPPERLPCPSGEGHMPTGRTVVPQKKMTSGDRFRECQWIANEPSSNDSCKCRAPAGRTGIYCNDHEARARRPAQA